MGPLPAIRRARVLIRRRLHRCHTAHPGGGACACVYTYVDVKRKQLTTPHNPLPPSPAQFKPIAHATLTMVVPVIQNVTRIRRIVVGEKKPGEAFLVDTPLATKSTQPAASPVDDLRLADQMLRLALVGKPHGYSYWHFQFFVAADVNRILGRGAYGGEMESDLILHKIEGLTGTRVLVAPHDPASWRRCFMLLGEQELIDRAVQLLSGAITQGMAPTREGVRQVLALHQDPNAPLLEDDPRLEEIRKELKGVHGLRMVEVQVRGSDDCPTGCPWSWGWCVHRLTDFNVTDRVHHYTTTAAGRQLRVPGPRALRVQNGGPPPRDPAAGVRAAEGGARGDGGDGAGGGRDGGGVPGPHGARHDLGT